MSKSSNSVDLSSRVRTSITSIRTSTFASNYVTDLVDNISKTLSNGDSSKTAIESLPREISLSSSTTDLFDSKPIRISSSVSSFEDLKNLGKISDSSKIDDLQKEIININNQIISKLAEIINIINSSKNNNEEILQPNYIIDRLDEIVQSFNDVNQFSQKDFIIEDKDIDNKAKVDSICSITHDNRKFAKHIRDEIIKPLEKKIKQTNVAISNSQDSRLEAIYDANLREELEYLKYIKKRLKIQLELKDQEIAFDLSHIIDSLRSGMKKNFKNLEIDEIISQKDDMNLPILVDQNCAKALMSMIENLCSNSVDAGSTKISIKYSYDVEAKSVIIKYRDNGRGIQNSLLAENFFNKKWRQENMKQSPHKENEENLDKNRKEGTLNAYSLLEKSGGDARISENIVSDDENSGVEFSITAPTLEKKITNDISDKIAGLITKIKDNICIISIDDQKPELKKIKHRIFNNARRLTPKKDEIFTLGQVRNEEKELVDEYISNGLQDDFFNFNKDQISLIFTANPITSLYILKEMKRANIEPFYIISDYQMPYLNGNQLLSYLIESESFNKSNFYLNTADSLDKVEDSEKLGKLGVLFNIEGSLTKHTLGPDIRIEIEDKKKELNENNLMSAQDPQAIQLQQQITSQSIS